MKKYYFILMLVCIQANFTYSSNPIMPCMIENGVECRVIKLETLSTDQVQNLRQQPPDELRVGSIRFIYGPKGTIYRCKVVEIYPTPPDMSSFAVELKKRGLISK